MRHLLSYRLFEGGNALELARPIKYSELASTIDAIILTVFPEIGIAGFDDDAILIGSAGKVVGDETDAGDIDIGINVNAFAERNGVEPENVLKYVYDLLQLRFPMFQSRWLRGVDVVSFGFPICNNPGLGYVQVDFIPVKNMEWAKFVYNRPKKSGYKSAHRNWLFCAILSAIQEDVVKDDEDEVKSYTGYNLRLGDGLFKVMKTFEGKRGRLSKPAKLSEELVTNSPKEFLDFVVGEGIKSSEVETFESLLDIIKRPEYKHKDKLGVIMENYRKFLRRVNLVIPSEIKSFSNGQEHG